MFSGSWSKFKTMFLGIFFFICTSSLLFSWVAAAETDENREYLAATDLFNHGNWKEADIAFHRFQAHFPDSYWKNGVNLRLADLASDPSEAIQLYKKVLAEAGENEWREDAKWGLSTSLFMLGEYQQAFTFLKQISSQNNWRYAQALYLSGLCCMATNDFIHGQSNFSKISEGYPQSEWAEPALVAYGACTLALKKYPETISASNKYLAQYPHGNLAPIALMQKADAMQSNGKQVDAKKIFDELLTKYSGSFAAERMKENSARPRPIPTTGVSPVVKSSKMIKARYTIQVGAFSIKEHAQKFQAQLISKGYDAYLLDTKNGKTSLTLVRVGTFANHEAADKIANQLRSNEKIPVLVSSYTKP